MAWHLHGIIRCTPVHHFGGAGNYSLAIRFWSAWHDHRVRNGKRHKEAELHVNEHFANMSTFFL